MCSATPARAMPHNAAAAACTAAAATSVSTHPPASSAASYSSCTWSLASLQAGTTQNKYWQRQQHPRRHLTKGQRAGLAAGGSLGPATSTTGGATRLSIAAHLSKNLPKILQHYRHRHPPALQLHFALERLDDWVPRVDLHDAPPLHVLRGPGVAHGLRAKRKQEYEGGGRRWCLCVGSHMHNRYVGGTTRCAEM